ncbi:MoaD family protein [Chloroflexota bacterium]
MRIRVRGYLTLRDVIGDRCFEEIEAETFTLKDLIQRLSLELGDDFVHRLSGSETTAGVRWQIAILVNGCHYSHLPDRMATKLVDGDEVAIFPPTAGG